MRAALRDLRVLWETRHTSGFPWPTWRGFSGGWHMAAFGMPRWAAVPLWRKVLGIPMRPVRYARMVRGIARARNYGFSLSDYDDVP